MNNAVPLQIAKDITIAMETRGIITPAGDFDEAKLDTWQEDVEFAAAVESIFKAHGIAVPDRIDRIIKALPLLGLFIH